MPKALSPFADEDEKTTIESGWEEEASTTVEQGDVAEKIRSLGLRPITNVTGALDEPTMDDQRANAASSVITPAAIHARLIITQGNDQGQEVEVIPGKNYTIGRAIDNDVVLTDIAVSRKHFDLRFENSAWVLVDRGSGNGTLVNGNIEDNPFMLANGDAIEIGNTTFRFDHPNGVPRSSFNDGPSTNGFNDNPPTNGFSHTGDIVTRNADAFDVDMEEEPSTVAGKPLRNPDEIYASPLNSSLSPRPKTVPPPAPLPRTRPTSSAPPAYPMGSVPPMPNGFGLPPLQRSPIASPAMLGQQPPMLGSAPVIAPSIPSIAPHHPTMLAQDQMALANMMPTTIPGQGPPMQPSQPHLHALPFTYPNVNDHAQHAQQHLLVHPGSHAHARDATSTAHVQPAPYGGQLVMQPYVAPTLSRRTKLLLGGAGLTVLAAIATIAIIKGVSGGGGGEEVGEQKVEEKGSATKPTVQPIKGSAAPKDKDQASKDTAKDKKDQQAKDEKAAKDKKDQQAKDEKAAKDKKDQQAKDEKAAKDKQAADEKAAKDKAIADKAQAAKDKAIADKAARDQAAKDARDKALADKQAAKDAKDKVALVKNKAAADKAARDQAAKDARDKAAADKAARDQAAKDARDKAKPKQVAVAPTADVSAAKEKAKDFYKAKQFLQAAKTLQAAAASSTGNEQSLLKNSAAAYERFGRAYSNGMTSTNAADAWLQLQLAINFDNSLGQVYQAELLQRRSQIAGKAAITFVAVKNWNEAQKAIRVAEAAGSKGEADTARMGIESFARDLYSEAKKEKDSNPQSAKTKLNQIKSLVGQGNSLYGKADKLLAQING